MKFKRLSDTTQKLIRQEASDYDFRQAYHRLLEEMSEELHRKDVLLRAAYDLLKRSTRRGYVEEATMIEVRYDDANCDGGCLMNDIMIELDLEDGTPPIPRGPEDA